MICPECNGDIRGVLLEVTAFAGSPFQIKRYKKCPTCKGIGQVPDNNLGESPVSRDWTEDFSRENGNYSNHCSICGQAFSGHKRRVVCKLCASPAHEPVSNETYGKVRLDSITGKMVSNESEVMLNGTGSNQRLERISSTIRQGVVVAPPASVQSTGGAGKTLEEVYLLGRDSVSRGDFGIAGYASEERLHKAGLEAVAAHARANDEVKEKMAKLLEEAVDCLDMDEQQDVGVRQIVANSRQALAAYDAEKKGKV